jgi:signal transduction histidine kinase/ligand-binding sensor domain-containing protein
MMRTRTRVTGDARLEMTGCKAAMAVAAVAMACCLPAPALDPSLEVNQYAHTAWKVRNGFIKGGIFAMAQGPDGYLWLGTEFGLVRFDGVRAVPWQPPVGQRLPSNFITSLLFARDGTLWIGTQPGLTSWKDGKITTYPQIAGLTGKVLLQDRAGTIWVGVSRSPAGAKLCSIQGARMDCYGGDGKLGGGILGLYEDALRNLWVGTDTGFWRWKPGPPKFFPATSEASGIRGFADDDGRGLLVSVEGGIRRLVHDGFEARPLPYHGLTAAASQIFRDRDGSLWVTTFTHGLVHVHQGRLDTFSSSDGLSGDGVFSILEDREGNVWVGTLSGLDRFRDYSVATISRRQGLGGPVTSTLAARDGSVWITDGTRTSLNRWDHGTMSVWRYSNGVGRPRGTIDGLAPDSVYEDSSGRIWATTVHQLGYLDHGRIAPILSYPSGFIRGIAEGPPGHLWLASQQNGLLQVFQGKVVLQLSWRSLGLDRFGFSPVVDPAKHGLWIGIGQPGVAWLAENRIEATYSAADGLGRGGVSDLRLDSGGALWVATDGGLSRIKDGHILTLTGRDGLPCDEVLWSVEDNDHAAWVYMPCGLVRIPGQELDAWAAGTKTAVTTRVLDASDGVAPPTWPRSSRPQVSKAPDGRIWFTTSDGVGILDPHHLPFNSIPPPVHVENIVADGTGYSIAGPLNLPSRVRDLSIDYTALSLTIPEKVRFRVKLEGQDKDWRELVNVRHVEYTNLPPKNYRFRVIAANNSGVWNELGDQLTFSIAPAWFQTNWFRISCVAAFLVLLWGIYRLRVQRLQHQFAIGLEARVNERTRIARDLHDTLLQSIQGLMLHFQTGIDLLPERPVEARKKLETALDHADQAIAEGRDAVQGLRSSAVETNDLVPAVRALVEELRADKTNQDSVDFQVKVEGAPRNLDPILRDEVYRIAAEALRNAFRHAHAQRIEVEILYGEPWLRLRVRDDGKGIDPKFLGADGRAGHYGLHGMRERAKLVGGKLAVWSRPDSGTEVELSIPASTAYATSSRRRSWLSEKFSGKGPL